MFDFSPDTASDLLNLLSPFLPILATYLVARTEWSKELRFGISFLATILVAVLTAYVQGHLGNNFWSNLTQVFTAAQVIYWSAFKALGLEKVLFPKEALVSEVAEQAKLEVAHVSSEQAKAVLDPNNGTTVDVSANVVNNP